MSSSDEPYEVVDLSVLADLQQGPRRDAGHRPLTWEEARARCDGRPEPERSRMLAELDRLRASCEADEHPRSQ